MTITLIQRMNFNDTKEHWAMVQKEYTSNIIPHVNDKIEYGLSRDAQSITEVLLCYDNDSCSVWLEECMSPYPYSNCDELKKMVESYSWKIIIA